MRRATHPLPGKPGPVASQGHRLRSAHAETGVISATSEKPVRAAHRAPASLHRVGGGANRALAEPSPSRAPRLSGRGSTSLPREMGRTVAGVPLFPITRSSSCRRSDHDSWHARECPMCPGVNRACQVSVSYMGLPGAARSRRRGDAACSRQQVDHILIEPGAFCAS